MYTTMQSSSLLTAIFSIFALVAAASFVSAQGCRPNFQSYNVDIVTGRTKPDEGLYLAPRYDTPSVGDPVVLSREGYPFVPRFGGQKENSYEIKVGRVPANDKFLQYKDGKLQIGSESVGYSWYITCATCADPGKPYRKGTVVGKDCTLVDTRTNYQPFNIDKWDFVSYGTQGLWEWLDTFAVQD